MLKNRTLYFVNLNLVIGIFFASFCGIKAWAKPDNGYVLIHPRLACGQLFTPQSATLPEKTVPVGTRHAGIPLAIGIEAETKR